jgi:hypothetical protein
VLEGAGGGTCATVPTQNTRTISGLVTIGTVVATSSTRRQERVTALLAPDVRRVLAGGRPAAVVTKAQLPYGLRIAQIDFPRHIPPSAGPIAGSTPALLATGANGKALAYLDPEPATGAAAAVRWWEKPHPLPPGPCQLRARGLPALEPQWGHVAAAIRPYPAKIIGRTFFSCIDTEYYLHRWPLETAILLDAQHPGRAPAPIPGMKPVDGAAGVFDAAGGWQGEIAAIRQRGAWLVVAGGSGLRQRLEVLRHLTATVAF